MGLPEKIGLAFSVLFSLASVVEMLWPGRLAALTNLSRKLFFSITVGLAITGLLVVFLWPEPAPTSSRALSQQGTQSAGRDFNNSGPIYNAPVTVNPPAIAPSPPEPKPVAKPQKERANAPVINQGIINQAPNSGSQTVINGPPPPSMRWLAIEAPAKRDDGMQYFRWNFELASLYPVNVRCAAAYAESDLTANSSTAGMMSLSTGKYEDGARFIIFQNIVSGRYLVDVTTKADAPRPAFRCDIN